MLQVPTFRLLLDRLLLEAGLSPNTLELVPDVQAWCHANGVVEDRPFRQAKCLCRSSVQACKIVMVEVLTDEMISSGKEGMVYRGFSHEIRRIDSDEKYLIHLMLHEIACHVLQSIEQEKRDRWAFDRLSRYAI